MEVYDEAAVLGLYGACGWTNYTENPEMLRRAFANSLCVLGAYEGSELIGLVRAVGDGVSILFIQDLLVMPDRQRKGIGSALLRELLVLYGDVYQVELLTDDDEALNTFYRSTGLVPAGEFGCVSFVRFRNRTVSVPARNMQGTDGMVLFCGNASGSTGAV